MSARGQGRINVKWTIDGIAVIKRTEGEKLILRRAQGSGRLQITAAIDNGGAPMVRSTPWTSRNHEHRVNPGCPAGTRDGTSGKNGQFVACERPRIGGPGFGQLFCTANSKPACRRMRFFCESMRTRNSSLQRHLRLGLTDSIHWPPGFNRG